MTASETYWGGKVPEQCDLMHHLEDEPHDIRGEFVDCATVFGPWAILCPACHVKYGLGVGTGRGQRYKRQGDGRWLRVEG